MAGSVFAVPLGRLPDKLAEVLPAGTTPVAIGGRALVSVAFVFYEPGGVLAYNELLAAVLTRAGLRRRVTLPNIWVDTEASLAGGRELWNIPKGLGRFERRVSGRSTHVQMERDDRPVASLDARDLGPLRPGWQAASLVTAQRLEGSTVVVHNAMRARPRALRARWRFASDGPLAWLAGRRPLASVALADMAISFGLRTHRS